MRLGLNNVLQRVSKAFGIAGFTREELYGVKKSLEQHRCCLLMLAQGHILGDNFDQI